MSIFWF